jgi:ribonuclease-3
MFTAWVVVAGERFGGAEGRSKKEAEQLAAEAAWRALTARAAQGADATAALPEDELIGSGDGTGAQPPPDPDQARPE